ncbi:MAG: Gfo/Idh/MocA family oxidoreductase [Nibricoccus sp.]
MSTVRIGVIGLGLMGVGHANNIASGKIKGLELTAVVSSNPAKRARWPNARGFVTPEEMFASGLIDAVLIATPHYAHTTIGIQALKAGLHVLVEKPISVHKTDAEKLVAAHKNKKKVFAVFLNQRTDPYFQKIRQLVQNGELGAVRRVQWTITDWFRTHAYYASSAWRATWAGEGGGVLLNQCLHNLDLFQWLFGMPKRVTGFCNFGRYHPIEAEDDVTAHFEYADGKHATLITSTGEAPGTNRLEVASERGRLVYENDNLTLTRNEIPVTEFSRTSKEGFAKPTTWDIAIPLPGHGGQHVEILQNFADAILDGKPLIAPAAEGLHSVELANAIVLSAWIGKPIGLPLNGKTYARALRQKIAEAAKKSKS